MLVLEVADLNSQAIEAVLDDELFYIILDWNDSGGYWEMGIRNSAYQTLVDGVSLVPNYPLTWQFRYTDMPQGELMALSANRGHDGPIPRDGFSTQYWQLVYTPKDELVVIGVGQQY